MSDLSQAARLAIETLLVRVRDHGYLPGSRPSGEFADAFSALAALVAECDAANARCDAMARDEAAAIEAELEREIAFRFRIAELEQALREIEAHEGFLPNRWSNIARAALRVGQPQEDGE